MCVNIYSKMMAAADDLACGRAPPSHTLRSTASLEGRLVLPLPLVRHVGESVGTLLDGGQRQRGGRAAVRAQAQAVVAGLQVVGGPGMQ